LDLLVFRYEELGGDGPLGSMLPQMLGQAAAVLVSFPARLATEFNPVHFAAVLDERLAVAGPTDAALLRGFPLGYVVEVVNGASLEVKLTLRDMNF